MGGGGHHHGHHQQGLFNGGSFMPPPVPYGGFVGCELKKNIWQRHRMLILIFGSFMKLNTDSTMDIIMEAITATTMGTTMGTMGGRALELRWFGLLMVTCR
jgi:hypothetical protein